MKRSYINGSRSYTPVNEIIRSGMGEIRLFPSIDICVGVRSQEARTYITISDSKSELLKAVRQQQKGRNQNHEERQ